MTPSAPNGRRPECGLVTTSLSTTHICLLLDTHIHLSTLTIGRMSVPRKGRSMTDGIGDEFQAAVEAYRFAPTADNRDRLVVAADGYREKWIVDQASRGASNMANARQTPTSYDRELEVMSVVDGIPVKLALQQRTSKTEPDPWWTLSWRTKYSAKGSNRRFYLADGACWTIPAKTALDMIDDLEASGGMHQQYFDRRSKSEIEPTVSIELAPQQRTEAFAKVTGPKEDWGNDPFFVITLDPNRNWKKVLIVNTVSGSATFRSITEDPDYMPKKVLRAGAGWWLDNSMMDASVQQMKVFQIHLRQYLVSRG